MKDLGTRTLASPRLTLRRLAVEDAEAVYANWASDAEVTRYLHWETHPDVEVTREVLKTWVESYAQAGYYNWGIEVDGVLVGNIAAVACDARSQRAEIGYCIGRAYWGQGIMTEALRLVLRFFFEEVGLHRVYLRFDMENVGSGRVMIKNGLTLEGTLRKHHLRKDGSWADIRVYGMLHEEWMALAGAQAD